MNCDGAVIREQGVTFGILIVKASVLSNYGEAQAMREWAQVQLPMFRGLPLVLAAQDAHGRFEYQGRSDLVHFLASIDSSRIPWQHYTVS